MVVICIILATWAVMETTKATIMEGDENGCADQLVNLASCIPFVSGTAKKSAPQCCQDTQKMKADKPKCYMCELSYNNTIHLSVFNGILNLSPDSLDAKIIFKEVGSSTTISSPPAVGSTSSLAGTGLGSSSNSVSKATPSSNNDVEKVKVFHGGNCLVLIALIAWIFI
ncbi:hypothetical protein ES319_D07G003700v1 [Gossypium barbadense]|uniref:Bifunctional inhibitor/plant lipid transfer protein/seed storage helical domain-containing protein n=2 Tax=Gossypium TaxID=3633 RepID=A0A5J5QKX3_GOSBA|nr:hypothetical protein ES319_D07G003700v1 [Gossypium barbadense]TYG59654.1 hypothetical protein ES288_D07G004000v1 [Gossypium darwinii]